MFGQFVPMMPRVVMVPVAVELCPACGAPRSPGNVVLVHGHEQCRCGLVVATCCEGSERFGQLPG